MAEDLRLFRVIKRVELREGSKLTRVINENDLLSKICSDGGMTMYADHDDTVFEVFDEELEGCLVPMVDEIIGQIA